MIRAREVLAMAVAFGLIAFAVVSLTDWHHRPACTVAGGVSSIGPVTLVNGKPVSVPVSVTDTICSDGRLKP